ncbi:hypothetical protein GCM10023334_076720 [Nonomuraea thailandensis]
MTGGQPGRGRLALAGTRHPAPGRSGSITASVTAPAMRAPWHRIASSSPECRTTRRKSPGRTEVVAGPVATGFVVDSAPSQTAGFGPAFGLAGGLVVLGGLAAMTLIQPDQPHSSMKGSRVARPPRERLTGAG